MANGALLQLEFANGECHAQYRHIPTLKYIEEEKTNSIPRFNPFNMLKKIITKNMEKEQTNPANTSVLPIPNSKTVYALC